jgi:hypothetical protein
MSSPLKLFSETLVRFFVELHETFPEEREIKVAIDLLEAAKKINPGMIRDVFYDAVTRDLKEAIAKEDDVFVISYARGKIASQYNEVSPALSIFDKHWGTMSDANRQVIWKYLKVLVTLNEKARAAKNQF